MKKLIKLFVLTLLIATVIAPATVFGARHEKEVPEENFAYVEYDENYWAKFVAHHPEYVFDFVAGKSLKDYTVAGFLAYDTKILTHDIYWTNPQQIIIPGPQIVQITARYEGEEIILSGEIVGIELEDSATMPTLTATKVILNNLTVYDINLDNKVSGSTYLWSSSDTDIVEVNPKNGLIKAKKEGRAIITCEITLPSGEVIILQSVVTVGYDDNAPVLTETILDLEVGDKFDINLENKIAKSKYRWVSSDRSVVKVNSSNGKVTAVGPGQAYVTCTITTPEDQVIVLRCDVTVTEPEE
jgi:uncharacterized protein YjdB